MILSKRLAVVTGASAGIGNAIARYFADNGARIVINARRAEPLQELERTYNNGIVNVIPVIGDASKQEIVDELLDTAKSRFGSEANLIVVNAGRGLSGSVMSSDVSQWAEMIQLNIMGCLRLLRSASERLIAQDAGQAKLSEPRDIVILGSNVGRHISPFSSVYGATKFAVNSLAEALRREIGPKGIRVTLIEPGIVATEFQKVAGYDQKWFDDFADRFGPVLEPIDIARLVTFIVSQPPHVHINDVVIRPTRQDYP